MQIVVRIRDKQRNRQLQIQCMNCGQFEATNRKCTHNTGPWGSIFLSETRGKLSLWLNFLPTSANLTLVAHLCDRGLFCRHGWDLICCDCCEYERSTIPKITGPPVRLTHTNEKPCRHSLSLLLSEGMSWFKVSLTRWGTDELCL